jgi:hypothetical protein
MFQDFLDINALCAGSIAAITTGAAAIAPYGAAVHAACANNHFLKTPKSQAGLGKGKHHWFVVSKVSNINFIFHNMLGIILIIYLGFSIIYMGKQDLNGPWFVS